jgi:pimeloyl-ACP methyl ester carboxylesterase
MALNFTERGSGSPVLLIHGFPLNQTIWNHFADELAKSSLVFTVDLPGFGKSPALKSPFTIEDVASEIGQWLKSQKIESTVVVGHSLGGYVALALAKQRPAMVSGLALFHSTAYADSVEKKENRNKVLDFISKNGVLAFTSNFIPPLFADQHHLSIETVRKIAVQATKEAVIDYTKAMRDRKDQSLLLKEFHKPIMIISGEKDQGISVESVQDQAKISKLIEFHILTGVAHMGMFEQPEKTIGLIKDFAQKSNRP